MQGPTTLQGRPFGPQQRAQVQALIRHSDDGSGYRLSRPLAQLWDWRTPHGQLTDRAARTLLLKLPEQGWIELSPRRLQSPTRSGRPRVEGGPALAASAVEGALESVLPLRLHEVSRPTQRPRRRQLAAALPRHRDVGYRRRGDQTCRIGWATGGSAPERAHHLGQLAKHTRFLILPCVRVPHLASPLLGPIGRRLRQDWPAPYGQPLGLLATGVERPRFAGTCYRAAPWRLLGQTQGRGRQVPQGCGPPPSRTSRCGPYTRIFAFV